MMTVHEVSARSGVTIRALRWYDKVGLLRPAALTAAGYRLYDEAALERLQQILLFRELDFPLKTIRAILDAPNFDRARALEQQITLLTMRRERLDRLIDHARRLQAAQNDPKGEETMDFTTFDDAQLRQYTAEAQAAWGQTEAWREYAAKSKHRTPAQEKELGAALMAHFAALGALRGQAPDSADVQAWVQELQAQITRNWYTCTPAILAVLGQEYAAGGAMTRNIDKAGGEGTAALAAEAVRIYCET